MIGAAGAPLRFHIRVHVTLLHFEPESFIVDSIEKLHHV